jgi:hypothetical protein
MPSLLVAQPPTWTTKDLLPLAHRHEGDFLSRACLPEAIPGGRWPWALMAGIMGCCR